MGVHCTNLSFFFVCLKMFIIKFGGGNFTIFNVHFLNAYYMSGMHCKFLSFIFMLLQFTFRDT